MRTPILAAAMTVIMSILPAVATAAPVESSIVYQGRLDAAGEPMDGVVDLRFRLYDALADGSQVGSELTKLNHLVDAGLFTVSLDFGDDAFSTEQRWLEIDVKGPGDAEYSTLSPRQPVSASPVSIASLKPWSVSGQNAYFVGGNIGIGNGAPLSRLHVTQSPLMPDASAFFQDDLIVEDTDAILSLLSDPGGGAGSGLLFKEIDESGLLADMWGLYRRTSGAGSSLRFSHGISTNYAANPTVFEIEPDGDVVLTGTIRTPTFEIEPDGDVLVEGVVRTPVRTRTKVLSRHTAIYSEDVELRLTAFTQAAGSFGKALVATGPNNGVVLFRLDLPIGSLLTSVEAHVLDTDVSRDIDMFVWGQEFFTLGLINFDADKTSGVPGETILSGLGTFKLPITETRETYVTVSLPFSATEGLQLFDLRVTYETTTIE